LTNYYDRYKKPEINKCNFKATIVLDILVQ